MRVLWLSPYFFWPPRSGGQTRLLNLVRETTRAGHEVDVWCIGDSTESWPEQDWPGVRRRCFPRRTRKSVPDKLLSLVHPLSELASASTDRAVLDLLTSLQRASYDVVVLEHAHLGAYGEVLAGRFPWVVDAQNLESDLVRQTAAAFERRRTRARVLLDAAKLARLERRVFERAGLIVAVSSKDRQRILAHTPAARVEVHQSGVDLDYFHCVDHSEPRGASLVMTGPLAYPPNLDAIRWLRSDLMPAIRRAVPAAHVTLVGRASDDLLSVHDPGSGLVVAGEVDDVRPYLQAADAFVIPLRIGGGTRLKAVEALASGLPTVSTSLGVEGLDVEATGAAVVADGAGEFAGAVRRVLTDGELRRRLVVQGRAHVEERFDWRRIGQGFVASLEDVARQARTR